MINQDGDETTIKSGDVIVWKKSNRTIMIIRQGPYEIRFTHASHSFPVQCIVRNENDFFVIAHLLALASNLAVKRTEVMSGDPAYLFAPTTLS